MLLRLLEAHRGCFLQWGDAAVADARVGGSDVLDQFGRPDQVPHAPARGVEILARGANGEGYACEVGGEGCHAVEGDVVEPVVDFVGEDEDLVF